MQSHGPIDIVELEVAMEMRFIGFPDRAEAEAAGERGDVPSLQSTRDSSWIGCQKMTLLQLREMLPTLYSEIMLNRANSDLMS